MALWLTPGAFSLLAVACVAHGRNLAATKFAQVSVSTNSWSPFATSSVKILAGCSSLCSDTYNCGAFAFDPTSESCELGPQPNLPADADPAGKKILAYQPPSDCRSAQAISEGYQSINYKYYKLGTSKKDRVAAVSECEAAGGRLPIFDRRDDLDAIRNITNGLPGNTIYWAGVYVPAEKGTATCNSDNGANDCDGYFVWDDQSPVSWTESDMQNWSLGLKRNYANPGAYCGIIWNGKLDDAECSGWGNAYPICQIDCTAMGA